MDILRIYDPMTSILKIFLIMYGTKATLSNIINRYNIITLYH